MQEGDVKYDNAFKKYVKGVLPKKIDFEEGLDPGTTKYLAERDEWDYQIKQIMFQLKKLSLSVSEEDIHDFLYSFKGWQRLLTAMEKIVFKELMKNPDKFKPRNPKEALDWVKWLSNERIMLFNEVYGGQIKNPKEKDKDKKKKKGNEEIEEEDYEGIDDRDIIDKGRTLGISPDDIRKRIKDKGESTAEPGGV